MNKMVEMKMTIIRSGFFIQNSVRVGVINPATRNIVIHINNVMAVLIIAGIVVGR